ncbi:Crp/Fnr family transcriptional regulator [Roseobacteraceae bacterium S113]
MYAQLKNGNTQMKVSVELKELFSRLGVSKPFPKRCTLLHEGDVSQHAYFIESGCIRLWYNKDGADVSVKFFLPGELCALCGSDFEQSRIATGSRANARS